jgi:hypothetical protein
VRALRAAADDDAGADGAWLVRDAHPQWLLALYRRGPLVDALEAARDHGSLYGVPVRRLVAGLHCVELKDGVGLTEDVDTWDDVRRVGARLADELEDRLEDGPEDRPAGRTQAPTRGSVGARQVGEGTA